MLFDTKKSMKLLKNPTLGLCSRAGFLYICLYKPEHNCFHEKDGGTCTDGHA